VRSIPDRPVHVTRDVRGIFSSWMSKSASGIERSVKDGGNKDCGPLREGGNNGGMRPNPREGKNRRREGKTFANRNV